MKRRKKRSDYYEEKIRHSIALIMCAVMIFSQNAVVFAGESRELEVSERGAVFTAKFPVTKKISKTYSIKGKTSGYPVISRDVGTVTLHATIKYNEIWNVDDKGNKISYVGIEGKKIADSPRAYAQYKLNTDCSVSGTACTVSPDKKSVVISGFANFKSGTNTGQSSYRFEYKV